jgi:hypothetical protein
VEELPHDIPGAIIPVDLAGYDLDKRGAKGVLENTGFPVAVWSAVGHRYLPQYPRSKRGESDEMLWGYLLMCGTWIKKYPSRDADLPRILQFYLPNDTLVKVRACLLSHAMHIPYASMCVIHACLAVMAACCAPHLT